MTTAEHYYANRPGEDISSQKREEATRRLRERLDRDDPEFAAQRRRSQANLLRRQAEELHRRADEMLREAENMDMSER